MQHRATVQDRHFTIRLSRGEKVMDSLTRFCEEEGIQSGVVSAVGAVKNTEMGYYDLQKREYFFKTYLDDMEVVSMTGNVALVENKPFLHVHAVLSDTDNTAHGGHLKEAEVAVTLEVQLVSLAGSVERKLDESIGLKLLDI
jgi:hypothetical protein